MRNLFSFNVEENSEISGSSDYSKPFILREVNASILKNQKKIKDKMDELEKLWALPLWLSYARIIALALGAMLIACSVMILLGVGFAYAFSAPWFVVCFILGIILAAFGTTFYVTQYKKRKKVEEGDEYKNAMKYIDDLAKKSENALNLPKEKTMIDVFFYPYIVRDNKMKDSGAFKYVNMSLYLFEEENKLCLSNNNTVYGIDKALFKRIVSDPKKTSFSIWNKDEAHNSEAYKNHKITLDHYGIYHLRNACSVQFENSDGQEREIIIPPYEVPHFEKLLDIKLLENEDDETVK